MLARVFRGYAPEAVDKLLHSITETSQQARTEIQELEERMRRLGAELEELELPDRELRETFVTAQRQAAELRAKAAHGADAIHADVRRRARERTAWLETESARLSSEIERMRGIESELHESMRGLLRDALRRLDEPVEAQADVAPEPLARNGTAPVEEIAAPSAAGPGEETGELPVVPAGTREPAGPSALEPAVEARPHASRSIVYSIAIIVAAAGIGVAIWQLRADAPEPAETMTAEVVTTAEPSAEPETALADVPVQAAETAEAAEPAATTAAEPPTTAEEPGPPPAPVALLVRAAGGDCWLSVRAGSESGKLLFEGFLFEGESRRFEAKRVWMRVGNGGNLAARLNGTPLRGLPAGTGDVLVTADGAQTLASG